MEGGEATGGSFGCRPLTHWLSSWCLQEPLGSVPVWVGRVHGAGFIRGWLVFTVQRCFPGQPWRLWLNRAPECFQADAGWSWGVFLSGPPDGREHHDRNFDLWVFCTFDIQINLQKHRNHVRFLLTRFNSWLPFIPPSVLSSVQLAVQSCVGTVLWYMFMSGVKLASFLGVKCEKDEALKEANLQRQEMQQLQCFLSTEGWILPSACTPAWWWSSLRWRKVAPRGGGSPGSQSLSWSFQQPQPSLSGCHECGPSSCPGQRSSASHTEWI